MKRALFVLLISVASLIAVAMPQAPPPNATLYIIHADWCAPCRRFDAVYQNSKVVRDALHKAFVIRELDWEKPADRAEAMRLGIRTLPTFLAMRGNRVISNHAGFADNDTMAELRTATNDLMADLGVDWPATTSVDPPAERPAVIAPASQPHPSPVDRPLIDEAARKRIEALAAQSREQQQANQLAVERLSVDIDRLQKSLETANGRLEAFSDVHEAARADSVKLSERISQQLSALQAQASIPAAELDQLRTAISETSSASSISKSQINELRISLNSLRSALPNISTEISAKPAESAVPAVGGFLAKAAQIGVAIAAPQASVPLGIGISIAGWLIARRRQRVANASPPASNSRASSVVPIAVDSAPLPQVIHTETHFVDVEKDTYAKAHAWASEQLVRKYPGTAASVETLQSLIRQFLDANK